MAYNLLYEERAERKPNVCDVVSAIGTDEFIDLFLLHVNDLCGADHCSIVQFDGGVLRARGAASLDRSLASKQQLELYIEGNYWRRDPGIIETQRELKEGGVSFVQMDISGVADKDLRESIWSIHNINQRILLAVGRPEEALGLSLCWSKPIDIISNTSIGDLQGAMPILLAILKKHALISWIVPRMPLAMTNLQCIERTIRISDVYLPKREFEVCCRLILGMSTTGISLELEIGEGSVMTYRKRIYNRLNIATQRELIIWYLALWDEWFRGIEKKRLH